ncbi:MAG TPA: hypothetical protein VJQ08_04860 [Candidatus Dormibacteraeota bacterium]|nr:hypothetical protein [Candidatus Dormibacteraeota bacterium]
MRLTTSLGVLACLVFTSACVQLGSIQHKPVAVRSHDPGQVDCPGGKAVRPGLKNFGAYIGTWEANHRRDTQFSTAYSIGMIPGRVVVDCSSDDFVVVEAIYPRYQAPAGQALRVALTDLPDDSTKIYEHTHTGCRTFQFQSKKLALQLGADDNDGRVAITFESQTATYNPASIYLILINLHDSLGQDTWGC